MPRKCLFRAKIPFRKRSESFVGCTNCTHNLTPIFVDKKVRVVHNGLQTFCSNADFTKVRDESGHIFVHVHEFA